MSFGDDGHNYSFHHHNHNPFATARDFAAVADPKTADALGSSGSSLQSQINHFDRTGYLVGAEAGYGSSLVNQLK